MSLTRQLWLAITVIVLLFFGGSVAVSTLSARHYLEQELRVKNMDNASSLALSMTQMEKDPVMLELLLSAQFDTGHYQHIRLTDPQGRIIVNRSIDENTSPNAVPVWFARLAALDAEPGTAQVQDGWRQYGTLSLQTHTDYALVSLWNGTLHLLGWFLLLGVIAGLFGSWLLHRITRPLGDVVRQAEAIGERRFIRSPEPRTREFRSLVRAMNTLSQRVHRMLETESSQIQALHRQSRQDPLTGLATREHFLNTLDAALQDTEGSGAAALVLVRVGDLGELNRRLGHTDTDHCLRVLGERLAAEAGQWPGGEAGRLNGSDFALMLPGNHENLEELARALAERVHAELDQHCGDTRIALPVAAVSCDHNHLRGELLVELDGTLAAAEQFGDRGVQVCSNPSHQPIHRSAEDWRSALDTALDSEPVDLGHFPVVRMDGTPLHHEAPARLYLDGERRVAGYFIPWAARLGLVSKVDRAVINAALERLADPDTGPLAVNLSRESMLDPGFINTLCQSLQTRPDRAQRLWIEVPEHAAVRHLDAFRALCSTLRPLGCRLGMDHVGADFDRFADVHDLGLDYMKVAAALTRHIHRNPANQTFLRGLCTVSHSIGLLVIAQGVSNQAESDCLRELGLDGITGPLVSNDG